MPTPVHTIPSSFFELIEPATTHDLLDIQTYTESDASSAAIVKLRDNYQDEIVPKRLSVLDILEQHTDISLPFATFLHLLPPMRVRQYSISSSPLVDPQRVSLNIGVFAAPSLSESGGTHLGIASTYLAGLKPGDRLPLAVRPSNAAFHLPGDPSVPLVMLCAGSGLAPFSQMFGWRSPSLLSFCLFSVVLPRYSSYPESKQTEDFSITIPGTKRQN